MDTFVIVDMYIFIVIAFLRTPLIKNQILRYVVYKPYLLLLLLIFYRNQKFEINRVLSGSYNFHSKRLQGNKSASF